MINAPQGETRIAKEFQSKIIGGLVAKLQSAAKPPCLLRSPTGSGKTFMLTRALQQISSARPTLWLWFVPYVNLVAQTVDSIDSEGAGLIAVQLTSALNEQPAASLVLISTVQGVASAKDRKAGYTSTEDDERRSLASYIGRAKAQGLQIGCVVDEAHIALKSTTEFGQFVQWLSPDHLLMATATPKDDKLSQFITASGYSHYETFSVSRADVVRERLNKAWIETVVYDLRDSMQSVTDLKLTVLRRAWRRNQRIAQELQARGLATVPLLLVQVGNGDEAIGEAQDFLMRELGVPAHAIGMHSADEPDPVMMAAIANDSSKQALIFKQSAGTGFDAPRAFVLASTKPVNDPDFAAQFIGRVMRVAPELQRVFPDAAAVPAELDTAYVFLANAEAQAGFAEAANAIKAVKSELEGQTEALHLRRTAYGGVALTNRVTDQTPLTYDLSLLPMMAANGAVLQPEAAQAKPSGELNALPLGTTGGLFDDALGEQEAADELMDIADIAVAVRKPIAPKQLKAPSNAQELMEAFEEAGIRTIKRNAALNIPARFITEVKPVFEAMALDVQAAVQLLPLEPSLQSNAIKAALNRMTEREIYTELFTGEQHEEDVQVMTDADSLLDITLDKLQGIGLEEQGAQDTIAAMAQRLHGAVEQAWMMQEDAARPAPGWLRSKARQAACWVIHKRFREFEELLHAQWATKAREEEAQALPDALLLPASVQLIPAKKNSYGIMFPFKGHVTAAREALQAAARARYESGVFILAPDVFSVAAMDATYELNDGETKFAKALERAPFVHWWHRNPDGKPFSVGLIRADSEKMFYPDFVVCMEHVMGEPPMMRLVDPKHDTKDASRKSKHVSRFYGKVLFLTKDNDQFKIVNDDGSVGAVVDYDDLGALKDWMRASPPLGQGI
ncbi:DEAD/DEAH box helicase family protein [Variovorax sp. PCZ-1]|uniref:DEAD/DEAH box helicase n=1 Tax=Variovorax sp. PCZ-1 TaxID=2835533 RepID=UPI001BCCA442|nr:DEAD/DEAH box helicase family protein [Variovorax sp. PCZ-1]MBS7806302.1 DEAD/DEAH box helicase family protein [Variovorax sp. PCZ-1]